MLSFFSSRRRHTRFDCDWSSDVCSSDLVHFRVQALEFGMMGDMQYVFSRRQIKKLKQPFCVCLRFKRSERSGCNDRSEERRVGKECRSRWSPYQYEKNDSMTAMVSTLPL